MPGFDRRGPNAEGPKTGRGLGRCSGNHIDSAIGNQDRPRRRLHLHDGSCGQEGKGRGRGRCRQN
ncbi:DUF5320 domain-containing protein [Deferribacteraceae bacterium V6Fe1]|nr:DUF5320 domain-containing protein [Deferribacteraceae bacterium V6Fe1]